MNKRKMIVSGAAIAGIIAVIAGMWFIKNGSSDSTSESIAQTVSSAESMLDPAKEESSSKPSSEALPVTAESEVQKTEVVVPEKKPALPAKSALLDGVLNLTKPFNLAEYRASGVPVIIDFGADSCIPCKEMAPVLVALHDELKGKAIIRFVDVWKYRDLADGIPLQVIPTQVFFDAEGNPFTPSEKLQIQMNQYVTKDTNEHVFTTHEGGITKEQLLAVLAEMGMKK